MSSYLEASFGYLKDEFDKTCTYCGSVFHVVVPGQKGHEESEEYYCPECMTEYHCRASNSPTVILVSKRTDGRDTRNIQS